ncbi:MAG: PQQ-binding-like beta-propeller repeat protein, partial [Verrucomicrobia bacterium]|nr:PQQ-binding-like beta-propeller repeat protein [Verrucomicrobiota bacterium]
MVVSVVKKNVLSAVGVLAICASAFGGISDVVRESGVKAGVVVHLGCGDGRETGAMLLSDRLLVQGLDRDASNVAKARDYLSGKGIYGKVTVSHFDGKRLPYADNLVNLIVADALGDVPRAEVLRVLAPLGSAIISGKRIAKPWPKEIDEWGHFLHGPDNNAVVNDSVVGMPRNIQWINGPKWQRSHEEFSTVSVAVSSAGRLFYIVDRSPQAYISFNPQWKLVARDAFNGMLLWERDVPVWVDHMRQFRSGPAHLQRRLVAKGDSVYVTLGLDAPLSKLDATTGETLKVYEGTAWTEEIIAEGDSLYLLVGSSETSRFGSGLFERDEPPMRRERFMVALDEADGNERWRIDGKGENFIMPLGMALSGGRLFYHNVKGLGCLDPQTGTQHWFHNRPVVGTRYGFSTSTLVATPDVVLLADKDPAHKQSRDLPVAAGDIKWAVGGWNEAPLTGGRTGLGFVTAYAADSGKELWKAPCAEGYNVPVDVLVNEGLVWVGPFHRGVATKQGYDLKSGQVVKTISTKGDPVGMVHDRCYRNKASSSFIFTCRDGIEVHDYETGWIRNNSWTRGPCQFGIMPCNGLMYVPTDPCACHLKTRIHGFKAYASERLSTVGKPLSMKGRLVKGPAFSERRHSKQAAPGSGDWPGYRNDISRSGSTAVKVAVSETPKWSAHLGGKLTQPVVAGGMVYLASSEANTVYALDSTTGDVKWQYVAGSTIDSSPTVHSGRVLFGCADGRVYCLDARSGQVAWRFTAAPEARQVCIHGRLQSTWPVHGSVIVSNNEVTFTAGRSSFLSGGLYFYRLNATTGEVLAHSLIFHVDPATEQQLGPKETRFDGVGVVSDLLTSDGESCFLK